MSSNRNRSIVSARSAILLMSRGPLIVWISITFGGCLILQSLTNLQLIPLLFFIGLIMLHASLTWHSASLTQNRPWIYLDVQALLINGAALLMPDGAPILIAALNPIMISQSYVIYPNKRLFATALFKNILLFCITTSYLSDPLHWALYFVWFIPMCVVMLTVTNLAVRQLQNQYRTQSFLTELEIAHQQVEELSIANERQRMARDLHDTLAQGLAGIVMQLEAIDANLANDRPQRAQDIVHQAMNRARSTLAEARGVIDNLRMASNSNTDFGQAIAKEMERFKHETKLLVHLELDIPNSLSKLLCEHTLYIIRESLANIAKHSKASQAWVAIHNIRSTLNIHIRDDGIGFNPATIGQSLGHYGLVGMQERVRIIGGSFEIESSSEGTLIRIQVPLPEGEDRQ
ncbi:sensor histidine kinase [Cohnella fermenti]|uniref:histidine kinase n=1 Tax=Cohnella fermenti TaxID=2565925 RepID=A0A4V3WDP7_9BACL|nr:sensor histidine kinase [Cohnella fermenti]THF72947.1 sensor histidine kinase [Cohnella fermenti]